MTEEVPIDHVPTKVAKNNDVKDESTGNTQPDTEMLAYRKAVMEHAFVGPPSESRDEAGLESNLDTDSDPIIITGHAPATLSEGSQTSGNPNAISTRDSVEKSKAPVKFTDPIPASTAAMQTSEHDTGTASQNSSVATLSMKALFYHKNSLISGKLVVDQRNLLFEATPGSDRRKNYLTIGMRKIICAGAISCFSQDWKFLQVQVNPGSFFFAIDADRVRSLVSFVGSLITKSNLAGDDGHPLATSNMPTWDEPVAFAEAMAVMSIIHENKLLLPAKEKIFTIAHLYSFERGNLSAGRTHANEVQIALRQAMNSKAVRAARHNFMSWMIKLYSIVAPEKVKKVPSFIKRYESNGLRVLLSKLMDKYQRKKERVTKIFKEMEHAVNQYESALAAFSKKASSPRQNNLAKPNGIFGKLGNYAMSLFGTNASDTAAPNAQTESQTATSARAGVPAQVPNQEKKKQALPSHIPKFVGRPSCIITKKHIAELLPHLPMWCRRDDWMQLYSLSRDGVEMDTFLRKVAGKSPTLVFMKTDLGDLLGCFASHSWTPTSGFFGSGDSFLFSFRGETRGDSSGGLECFKWTNKNDHFQFCQTDAIALGGGGGNFGLYAGHDFESCSSGPCLTYGNTGLASQESFSCVDVEVFCFEIP